MIQLTSDRERRLWFWAGAVVLAIYATLPLAGTLAAELRRQNLLGVAFAIAFFLVIAAVVGSELKRPSGQREIWVSLGVLAVYGMVVVRMSLSAEERSHLFEYGLLAVLIHQALTERIRNGGRVRVPALVAILATTLLGWVDEGIQGLLPDRTYDIRDVGINALAGLMAIVATSIIRGARRWRAWRAQGGGRGA